jgi:hypothetical protein
VEPGREQVPGQQLALPSGNSKGIDVRPQWDSF